MALKKATIERFDGLNLRDDLIGERSGVHAIDLLNVDFDRNGRVRARDADDAWASLVGNNLVEGLYPTHTSLSGSTGDQGGLMAFSDTGASQTLEVINDLGTVTTIGTFGGSSDRVTSVAQFGTTTATTTYIASHGIGLTGATVQKFNGSTLSAGTGKPKYVAVSPRSNRLAQAHYVAAADAPGGANGSRHTVFFSDEGAPDTYTATNFVVLTPGDGEEITEMVTFRDYLIVFKQTRMFVFYSESVDDAGLVEFNYREISLGDTIPVADMGKSRVTVGDDAVYFSASHGIYRTTGGAPEEISTAIRPLWDGPGGVYVVEETTIEPGEAPHLYWSRGTLFAPYFTMNTPLHTSKARVLTWSPIHGQWSAYEFNDGAGMPSHFMDWPLQAHFTQSDVLGTATFFIVLDQWSSPFPDDQVLIMYPGAESFYDWYYQTGYFELGGGEARTRYMDVYGSGSVDVSVLAIGGRSGAVADVASTLTLGTAPAQGRDRRSGTVRGRMFAHRFEGTYDDTNPARISRVEHYFASGSDV